MGALAMAAFRRQSGAKLSTMDYHVRTCMAAISRATVQSLLVDSGTTMAADPAYCAMLGQLAAMMASMERSDAAQLAAGLTNRVNLRMLDPSALIGATFSDAIERLVQAVLPEALMNYATLGLPWTPFVRYMVRVVRRRNGMRNRLA